MPWTVKDVDSKKKGLTPAQKKKWVSTANGVLKDCQKKGGKDCEGKAIRIANSKFERNDMKTLTLPKGALRLVDVGCHAEFLMGEKEDTPKLKMKVYSGGVIEGHWYWDRLAIDLKGVKFDRTKYPILEQHMTSRKIGYSGKPTIDGAITLNPDNVVFVDTEASQEFQKVAEQGFPFQASLYAVPSVIERVEEGEKVQVNGFIFKGPGHVWRKCLYQESSVCVFGWDKQTESSVFSKEETEINAEMIALDNEQSLAESKNLPEKGGEEKMDIKKLTEEHPDLVKEIQKEVEDRLKAKFAKEKKVLTEDFESKLEEKGDRILTLEKKDDLRTEKERIAFEDKIWTEKLVKSDVGEHLFDKIKRHVSISKYVKDDIVDEEAFGKAVDDEIKDWESRGAKSTVLGTGSVNKEDAESGLSEDEAKGVKKETDDLLALAGQPQKESTT